MPRLPDRPSPKGTWIRLGLMTGLVTPFSNPTWQALARETDLSVQLICSGASEISRADYTSHGRYATAQFGFANGLERLAKLILTSDSFLTIGMPMSDADLRNKGHAVSSLLDEVERIQTRRRIMPDHPRPTSPIATAVVACLDDFAAASRGRYANHASLHGNQSPHEPIARWWNSVCEPILDSHFRGTKRGTRALQESGAVGYILTQFGTALHFHENGSVITDLSQLSLMTHEREITQKWGRFYSLIHARWLSDVFAELTRKAGYTPGTEFFLGHYERLATLRVEDDFLRSRKNWPLI